jgi:putative transposase
MWTAESRAFVGDFGAGQALSDEQYALLVPLIPPAKPGGRPRTTDMRRLLDGLFYLVRTGRLPVAPPAAAPGLPALADRVRLHARLRGRGRGGGDPPPPRGDAARAGGA